MSSKANSQTTAEIEIAIRDGSTSEQRKLFIQKRALDELIAKSRSALATQLAAINCFFDPTMKEGVELKVHDIDSAISNAVGPVFNLARPGGDSAQLADLLALEAVIDTPATRAAVKLLDPLFEALAAAKLREAEQDRRAAEERQAKVDAIEARRAALEAEIEAELATV